MPARERERASFFPFDPRFCSFGPCWLQCNLSLLRFVCLSSMHGKTVHVCCLELYLLVDKTVSYQQPPGLSISINNWASLDLHYIRSFPSG
jgi:hypothetical protein